MKSGTSSIVVAAFVGPGTVVTCASAGVAFGYRLGWVLLFATATVFILQSFTAATGILARRGLGEALRERFPAPLSRLLIGGMVVLGLWVGCAAFEVGNLVGAAAGVEVIAGGRVSPQLLAALAAAAGLVLLLDLRLLMRLFTLLVALMSALFVAALLLAPVAWGLALRGLVVPALPAGSHVTVIALVGTTVVTYNLFLHASVTRVYYAGEADARRAWRRELAGMALFIPLGGLISYALLATCAALPAGAGEASRAGDFARLLEPAAGPLARHLFGLGLFAAGFTSAVTAPLAAASGVRELFGWPDDPRDRRFRLVWLSVILTGLVFSLAGWSPLRVIVAAQAANGVLLPFIAGFMLYLTGRRSPALLPRRYLAAGVLVVLVCALLGARTLAWVWGRL